MAMAIAEILLVMIGICAIALLALIMSAINRQGAKVIYPIVKYQYEPFARELIKDVTEELKNSKRRPSLRRRSRHADGRNVLLEPRPSITFPPVDPGIMEKKTQK